MTIEIKNYDTFRLIKGFLEVYCNSSSAQSYDASDDCLSGQPVDNNILKSIDKFLEQNPDL